MSTDLKISVGAQVSDTSIKELQEAVNEMIKGAGLSEGIRIGVRFEDNSYYEFKSNLLKLSEEFNKSLSPSGFDSYINRLESVRKTTQNMVTQVKNLGVELNNFSSIFATVGSGEGSKFEGSFADMAGQNVDYLYEITTGYTKMRESIQEMRASVNSGVIPNDISSSISANLSDEVTKSISTIQKNITSVFGILKRSFEGLSETANAGKLYQSIENIVELLNNLNTTISSMPANFGNVFSQMAADASASASKIDELAASVSQVAAAEEKLNGSADGSSSISSIYSIFKKIEDARAIISRYDSDGGLFEINKLGEGTEEYKSAVAALERMRTLVDAFKDVKFDHNGLTDSMGRTIEVTSNGVVALKQAVDEYQRAIADGINARKNESAASKAASAQQKEEAQAKRDAAEATRLLAEEDAREAAELQARNDAITAEWLGEAHDTKDAQSSFDALYKITEKDAKAEAKAQAALDREKDRIKAAAATAFTDEMIGNVPTGINVAASAAAFKEAIEAEEEEPRIRKEVAETLAREVALEKERTSAVQERINAMVGIGSTSGITESEAQSVNWGSSKAEPADIDKAYRSIVSAQSALANLSSSDYVLGNFGAEGIAEAKQQARQLSTALGDIGLKEIEISNGKLIFKDTGEEVQLTNENMQKLRATTVSVNSAIKSLRTDHKLSEDAERAAQKMAQLKTSMVDFYHSNKSSMKSADKNNLLSMISGIGNGSISYSNAELGFNRIKQSVTSTSGVVTRFFEQLRDQFAHRITMTASIAAFSALRKVVSSVYNNIVELDGAITDLQIATGYSRNETRELVAQCSDLAQALGATTSEVSEAADEWLRQGYSAEEATQLIEASMMLSKLGQIESSEATTALTSAMNGYGLAVEDVTSIVDKLTAVDMAAAASAGGIATAMAETATSAKIAGVSMDTLIGWLAQIKEVTQDADESVGTFMKTMLARMGAIKSGELVDPESSESLGDVESVLSGLGIKLRDSSSEFRNFEEVISEVAGKWDSFSSVQQKALAKAFAGTRQQEKFIVLMENYGDAMDLAAVSADSSGTALDKFNSSYLTSVEAAQNRLTAAAETFSMSLLNSGTIATIINGLAEIVSAFGKVAESTPLKVVAALSAGLIGLRVALKSVTGQFAEYYAAQLAGATSSEIITSLSGQSALYRNMAISVFAETGATNKLTAAKLAEAIARKTLTDEQVSGLLVNRASVLVKGEETTAEERNTIALLAAMVASKGLTSEETKQILVSAGLAGEKLKQAMSSLTAAGAFETEKLSALSLSGVLKTLATTTGQFIVANWELIAVIAAIGAAVAIYDAFTTSIKEANEAISEIESELDEAKSSIEDTSSKISEITEKISELEDKKGLSIVEQNQLDKLKQEKAELEAENKLLEERVELIEQSLEAANDEKWEASNKASIGAQYTDSGESVSWWQRLIGVMSKFPDLIGMLIKSLEFVLKIVVAIGDKLGFDTSEIQNIIDTMTAGEDVYSLVDAANSMAESIQAYREERALLAEKISNDTATEEEKERFEELGDAIKELEANYQAVVDELMNGNYESQALAWKLTISFTDPSEQLSLVKSTIQEFFDSEMSDISYEEFLKAFEDETNSALIGILQWVDEFNDPNNKIDLTDGLDATEFEYIKNILGDVVVLEEHLDDSTDETTQSITSQAEKLDDAAKAISAMANAYAEFYEKGSISYDLISDIVGSFDDLSGVDETKLTSLVDALQGADDLDEFGSALTDLSDYYIDLALSSDTLTDETKDMVALMLKSAGVLNYEEVATRKVALAKLKNISATVDLNNATAEEQEQIKALASELGMTTVDLVRYIQYMQALNDVSSMDTSDDIESLINLAKAANISAESLKLLEAAKEQIELAEYWDRAGITESAENARNRAQEILDSISELDLDIDVDWSEFGAVEDQAVAAYEDARKKLDHQYKMNEISYEQYMDGIANLRDKYLSNLREDSDEILSIEEELYEGEKELYEKRMSLIENFAENATLKGSMTEGESAAYTEAEVTALYQDWLKSSEAKKLKATDKGAYYEKENEYLSAMHDARVSQYEADKKSLDRSLSLNEITEEQYYSKLSDLRDKYYAGQAEYYEEDADAYVELYEKKIEIEEKWVQAAADSLEATTTAMADFVDASLQLADDLKSANESAFDLKNSKLKHQLNMGYITEEEYYEQLEKLYKSHFADKYEYLEQYWQYEEEIYEYEQSLLEDAKDGMESIHEEVVNMIKEEMEEAKDSISEVKDAYTDLLDIRKKALEDEKDSEDYDKEHAEKLRAVAEAQRQVDALSGDTSAAGRKQLEEAKQALVDAQEELNDFERDHAYDVMEAEIESQKEAIELASDAATEAIESQLDSEDYLSDKAWSMMDGGTTALHDQLLEYIRKNSTSPDDELEFEENWATFVESLGEYGDGTNAKETYGDIYDRIHQDGEIDSYTSYTDAEAVIDDALVAAKNTAEYTAAFADYAASCVGIIADFASDIAGILSDVTGNPYVGMASTGISAAGSSASTLMSSLASIAGHLAGGTNSARKTGVYRTDEFGEELKMLKTADGNYTFLTAGSKVINADATERLMKVINNPELLAGGMVPSMLDAISSVSSGVDVVDSSSNSVVVNPTFQITSSDPDGVASEIQKLMPKIAEYTFDVARRNSRASGRTRSITSLA